MKRTEFIERLYAGEKNFRHIDLRNEDLIDFDIADCDFCHADLRGTVIQNSEFSNCNFSNTDLSYVMIRAGSRFDRCQFQRTTFIGAHIDSTQFTRSSFKHLQSEQTRYRAVWFQDCLNHDGWFADATFETSIMLHCDTRNPFLGGAMFIDTDVTSFADAQPLRVGPRFPLVDFDSICRSLRNPNLSSFLARCGMPDIAVTYLVESAHALDPKLLMSILESTFISYGSPDEAFARRLRDELQRNGVRTFFFPTDALPGDPIHQAVRDGVNSHDRVILICSQASLTRAGVRNEIDETLSREARDGRRYLIPVTIDGFIFTWDDPLAKPIRDRVVADFRFMDTDVQLATGKQESDVMAPGMNPFNQAVQGLIRALRRKKRLIHRG